MPIDIVKKNDKDSTVNLKKRQFLYKKDEKTKKQKNKKSLEERLEKRFSHLPDMAYKQKRKIIWSTVIFFSAIIVFFWFYLASQGVLFYKSKDKEEQGGFLKLSELTYGFNKIKNISISSLPEKKDFILNLKKQIELAAEKNEIINSLKDNLQKKSEGEYNSESNKVVCDSGNLAATYPLPDYYIDNPVKILGRGKLLSGEFKISLKDSNGKILGESTGITEKGETMSAFAVELNYSAPETKTGVLQLYALRQKDENKDDLISIPVNFIVDLPEWNIYSNEEFGLKLKYPKKF
ncbi:MAG: Gmad2 immunoglobulin-like domain-containing protein [bacterium]